MNLTHLSDATLIDLASRGDLTPRMVVVILAEVKRRNAVDDLAERKASLVAITRPRLEVRCWLTTARET